MPQTSNIENQMNHFFYTNQFSWLLQMNPLYVPFPPFPSFLEFNFQKYIMPLCNLLPTLGRKHARFGPLSRCPFPASILVHPDFVSL